MGEPERDNDQLKRLPPIKDLASQINRSRADKRHTVGDAASYLVSHRADLARYESVEDLAVQADSDENPINSRAIVIKLQQVRSALARELWSRQRFIGVTVIDDLLFFMIRDQSQLTDPVLETLKVLRNNRVGRPGLLVFPLTGFGVLAGGLLFPLRQERLSFVSRAYGLAITPQTNSIDRSIEFLESCAIDFDVPKKVPRELILHWRRSRATEWFERNPLLVMAVNTASGDYYENEFLLLRRLHVLTSFLTMLAALQPVDTDPASRIFSTSAMNNRETLDIKHYMLLMSSGGRGKRELSGHCVPIHARAHLSELSQVHIEVKTTYWRRRQSVADSLYTSLQVLYEGEVHAQFAKRKRSARDVLCTKLLNSLTYFRRSLGAREDDWRSVISLAIAFEMILTDKYEPGVTNRLVRRAQALLRGVRGTTSYQQALRDLYVKRSEIVHSGQVDDVDLSVARKAYVVIFLQLVQRIDSLSTRTATPIEELTGVP